MRLAGAYSAADYLQTKLSPVDTGVLSTNGVSFDVFTDPPDDPSRDVLHYRRRTVSARLTFS